MNRQNDRRQGSRGSLHGGTFRVALSRERSMAQDRIHIVTHENGWAVKREGKSDVESVHATQKEAIDAGRDLALKTDADLVLHRTDGTFRKVVSVSGEEE